MQYSVQENGCGHILKEETSGGKKVKERGNEKKGGKANHKWWYVKGNSQTDGTTNKKKILAYTTLGSAASQKNYDKMPMILSGDFHVNFASNDSVLLVDFLREKLHLKLNNNLNEPTTRYGTAIDAIFERYVDTLESRSLFIYFSYHAPIVLFLQDSHVNPIIDNE